MKNYAAEFKKFVTGQYVFSGVRIALAIIIPSVILAHFGILREYFLFPLGTSFVGLTDQPGPFIRRRNALLLSVISFTAVAIVASVLKFSVPLMVAEIIFFGMFFTLLGVYGQRLAAVGSLSLVVLSIFLDGHLLHHHFITDISIFFCGCLWFFLIYLVVNKIQPYKLAGQMIGENYLELAKFLKIKAGYYQEDPEYDKLMSQLISQQVIIKNLQEETRETVFKTRSIVNEATTTSRLLMLMFLNSIDLHELLLTSENDYKKIHEKFAVSGILTDMGRYLEKVAEVIENVGIAMQSGIQTIADPNLTADLEALYQKYFDLRMRTLNADSLEHFLVLRQILGRVSEVTEEVNSIVLVMSQDPAAAKGISTRLDYEKFVPKESALSLKVLRNNLSVKSQHFRHAVRITVALLVGLLISQMKFLGLGHTYWILITILAILKPAYSITKSRNLLRLFGTACGCLASYLFLMLTDNGTLIFIIILISMILCFSFLKHKYFWAVFFMTVYIFLSFNILNPGNIYTLFKDRLLDTAIAGGITFLVSYTVLPVWEHTHAKDLMEQLARANLKYFQSVFAKFTGEKFDIEKYKIARKDALIALANLSDNFQRMVSDPKGQRNRAETIHQFVNTSHLITAYTASLSQYSKSSSEYPEIDAGRWQKTIVVEMQKTLSSFYKDPITETQSVTAEPNDLVEEMLAARKAELREEELTDRRDRNRITHLTEIKNIREILGLIHDVAREQRKVVQKAGDLISELR